MCRPSVPPKRKIVPKDVKKAIQQAKNLCYNFEDTPACRSAWEKVEELSSAFARQRERELLQKNLDEMCLEDPIACREYDM
jgi:hypothetical protein